MGGFEVWPVLVDGMAALLAFALAFGMLRLGAFQYGTLAPHGAEATPVLHMLGLVAGALGGVGLLLPDAGLFRAGEIFATDGAWSIGLPVFLERHALPAMATLRAAADGLQGKAGVLALLTGWGAILVLGAAIIMARRLWPGWRAAGAVCLLAVWIAVILHYAAHLLAWSLAQLNIWVLPLLLLLFQRWRYAAPATGH
ncbi:hypothetical protein C8P66_10766 [Humitalea rosea]|uniref:Uncharacterized protein n=1 Tax=Humitalea rosea TaxID=990373 RepID=A0A2W7INT2_9PROT|nr:hypothetical protein [Humitalea rosea]PZW47028.1 hypothetical protein C8P66_10766 [Humitalea rosea]